jgi:hypothetical protein
MSTIDLFLRVARILEIKIWGDRNGNCVWLEPVVRVCVWLEPVVRVCVWLELAASGLLLYQNLRTGSWSNHP